MAFRILSKQAEVSLENISTQVKRHKNGVVADALKKAGITYTMSYGVSVVHLRNIASRYTRNNALAAALWRKGWRETMMLSTLLFEPDEKGKQLLEEFTLDASTEEVFQQLGMHMLTEFEDAQQLRLEYLQSGDAKKRIVAGYAIARRFTGRVDATGADELVQAMLNLPQQETFGRMEILAIGKAMAKAGVHSNTSKKDILKHYQRMAKTTLDWGTAYELIKTEFEYR